MEIKDQTMTTDVDESGNEYVSEMSATMTETAADGTQIEAEITTTADPDDPSQVESHMTVTETAADGTQTVTEVVANEDGTFIVDDESALEQAIEEMFDIEIGDDLTPVTPGAEFSDDTTSTTEIYQAEPDFQTDFQTEGGDFNVGDEMYDPSVFPADASETTLAAEAPLDPTFENADAAYTEMPSADASVYSAPDASYAATDYAATDYTAPDYAATETTTSDFSAETSSETSSVDTEAMEQETHTQAATEAQAAADEFIAQGDYAAAAQARETAENEAWEAGDSSMLGTSDSSDLEYAAYKQEQAEYYEEQQAQHAREGDYEAAREDASNAAYQMGDADFYAGGDDHTGQAKAEEAQMDWAVYHEDIAEDNAFSAEQYAAQGDFEKAEIYAESAADEQAMADYHGDVGEHGAVGAVYDPSSEVSSGGSYDAAAVTDYSATDYSSDYSAVDYSATDTSTDYSTE